MISPEYENPKQIQMYDFGTAIDFLREGIAMRRLYWNWDHKIELQNPDKNSKMTEPYIYITTEDGNILPWIASHSDILKIDWYKVID